MKRIIVCGGRNYCNHAVIRTAIEALWRKHGPFTLVHGDCKGADRTAASVALDFNDQLFSESGSDDHSIIIEEHPADWGEHGKSAGFIRNRRMASLGADGCVAFPGGRGTANMVATARAHGIPVWDLQNVGSLRKAVKPKPVGILRTQTDPRGGA